MSEEVPRGVSVFDDQHKEFVKGVFERFLPGRYLLQGTYREKKVSFFKMDKDLWLSLFMHDHIIASLRRDGEVKGELEKVYRELAEGLGWSEKEPTWARGELSELSRKASEGLFNLYRVKLMVEGWRERSEETLLEGEKRGLVYEPSPVGDMYRTELGRWLALQGVLDEFEKDVRPNDKVALFMAMELNLAARLCVRGLALRHSYINYLLESLASGRPLNRWVEEALWCAYKSSRRFEDLLQYRYAKFLDHECLDWMVRAAMAAEGMESKSGVEASQYLADLAARLSRPELVKLYNIALWGYEEGLIPPGGYDPYMEGFMRETAELSAKEKRFFDRMYGAGIKFLCDMADVVEQLMVERCGCKVDVGKFEVENYAT